MAYTGTATSAAGFSSNPFPPGIDFSSAFNADLGLPSFGVSSAYNNLGNNANTSGGFLGGFGNFLNSDFMSNVGGPLLATGLSGIFANQSARNYGQGVYQATGIGALAGKNAAEMNFAFDNKSADLAQQRRQKDAAYQLALQKSKPFQDLVTRSMVMNIAAQDYPGAEMRAGYQTLIG